jgi:flagellar protein FliS
LSSYSGYHEAYIEGTVLSSNPVHLVVVLYEAAIASTRDARSCLNGGNLTGASAAIAKCSRILTQLSLSLNFQKGGEISQNLKRLYTYMQQRLSEAHASHKAEGISEVEKLLSTLLEGWSALAPRDVSADVSSEPVFSSLSNENATNRYGDYFAGAEESVIAVTF